jgi:ERCC4-type nuclease
MVLAANMALLAWARAKEAEMRMEGPGSRAHFKYRNMASAVDRATFAIGSGTDALNLKGIGAVLAREIDQVLPSLQQRAVSDDASISDNRNKRLVMPGVATKHRHTLAHHDNPHVQMSSQMETAGGVMPMRRWLQGIGMAEFASIFESAGLVADNDIERIDAALLDRIDPGGAMSKHDRQILIQVARRRSMGKSSSSSFSSCLSVPTLLSEEEEEEEEEDTTKPSYVPQYRSGPWSVVMALYNHQSVKPMTQHMLRECALRYKPNTTFTKTHQGYEMHSMTCLDALIKRNVVTRLRLPYSESDYFSLAVPQGRQLGKYLNRQHRLRRRSEPKESKRKKTTVVKAPPTKRSRDLKEKEPIDDEERPAKLQRTATAPTLASTTTTNHPWSFTKGILFEQLGSTTVIAARLFRAGGDYAIDFVLDVREHWNDAQLRKLLAAKRFGVERRTLPIGDFAWMVRSRRGSASEKQASERLLPILVEKKTVGDLKSTLTGQRWDCQLHRLNRAAGFKTIYLVEGIYVGDEESRRIDSALATLVARGVYVCRTRTPMDTYHWIVSMSMRLLDGCKRVGVSSLAPRLAAFVEEHAGSTSRTLDTVRDIFAGTLLQLSGVGEQCTATVIAHYPTPAALCAMLRHYAGNDARVNALALLTDKQAVGTRAIGVRAARAIVELFAPPINQLN